jgi:small GTP-binding protein
MSRSFKIVVTGPFNSGKTTIVRTLCELSMTTERPLTRPEESAKKPTTTVGMDFGVVDLGDGYVVRLFGTPGQRRFSFMWHILAKSMNGYVLMVDATDESSVIEAQDIFAEFRRIYPDVPYVIVANKQDLGDALRPEDIRIAMGLSEEAPVLPGIAKDHASAWEILRTLLMFILQKNTKSG